MDRSEYYKNYNLTHKEKIAARSKKHYEENKERITAQHKKWYEKHRDQLLIWKKEYSLKNKYGLDFRTYFELIESQNYECAICKTEIKDPRKRAIDHCHTSGTIRGILCQQCNKGLGHFGDDPKRLLRAAKYLQKYQGVGS